jgi:hypothetical protein
MIRTIGVALAALTGGTVLTIPKGTDIPITLDEDVPIERDRVGDTFEARVTRDVTVDGEVVVVAGSPAEVKLVKSKEKSDAATLRLTKLHVDGEMRRVETDVAKPDTEDSGLSTTEKTAVGAAAGVVVGAVTGAGVVEGAIVGAGGGLAWGLLDESGREVKDDTPLRFSLEEDLDL